MKLAPLVDSERSAAAKVTFTKKHAMIEMADGRVIGVPLSYFPRLKQATKEERKRYQLMGLNVYWEDLDEGIDLTAMLTGLYVEPQAASA